jgi:hypothetical protein
VHPFGRPVAEAAPSQAGIGSGIAPNKNAAVAGGHDYEAVRARPHPEPRRSAL